MKLGQIIKNRKQNSIVKKYKFCGITLLRKERTPSHKKYSILGIRFAYKYKNTLTKQQLSSLTELMPYIYSNTPNFSSDVPLSATIIIPIYNGLHHLHKLIPSLQNNTPDSVKIILINDNSPDTRISDYLNSLTSDPHFSIITNDKNLGFVGTINYGMSLVKTQYAVWLNSDTIVPQYWLERLLAPFSQQEKIATVTPFTNSGVIFSFPNFAQNNALSQPIKDIDDAFQKLKCPDISINEIYSGTGFCMAVNMKCWKEIGNLDIENFGKGYGEENDWCFRAANKNWKHLLAHNLFVQHLHGGSFQSDEKQKLCQEHQKILIKKYPLLMKKTVPNFFKNDPWRKYREAASLLCCSQNSVLIIDIKKKKNDKSGAIDYQQHLIHTLKAQGQNIILVQYERNQNDLWSIIPLSIASQTEITLSTLADVKQLFTFIKFNKIIINNLAFLSDVENTINILSEIHQIYKIPLVYKFHDYLSICPSFFLLNNQGINCNTYKDQDNCLQCLYNNPYRTIIRSDIKQWRKTWNKLFSIIDEFHFFSEYSYNKAIQIYPYIKDKSQIKEHETLFSKNYSKYQRPISKFPLTIAFVGTFVHEKGATHFVKLAEIFQQKSIKAKFIIIGIDNPNIKHPNITWVSGYTRDELGAKLTQNNVHAVIYSSINNETFSYVAQELMMLDVPFVCFENGAPQERIRKYHYSMAEIAVENSAESLFLSLQKLLEKIYFIKI